MYRILLLFISLSILNSSCKHNDPITNETAPSISLPFKPSQSKGKPVLTKGQLTLAHALSLTLYHNPQLKLYSHDLRLHEIARLKAAVKPNPEISFEIEDIMGTGNRKWLGAAAATLGISYAFEMGNKRIKKLRAAGATKSRDNLIFGMKKRAVLLAMSLQFVKVIYWEHQVALDKDMHTLDKKIRNVLKAKVEGDLLSGLQLNKYDLAMGLRRSEKELNENTLAMEKLKLATFWGVKKVNFSNVKACFFISKQLKPFTSMSKNIAKHPSLVYFKTLKILRFFQMEAAKSLSVPDITVSGGVRYYQDNKDVGGVIGVTIPIPINDNNRGEILEVTTRMAKEKSEEHKIRLSLHASLKKHHIRLKNRELLAERFVNRFLPAAKRTFKQIEEGYRMGKLSYLEVLDAKSMINTVHRKFHGVLLDYMSSYIVLSYLTGEPPAQSKKSLLQHCL
jgi:outer membrane protein, heavy metal efflux system